MLDWAILRGRTIFQAPPKIILYSKKYLIKLLELEGTINQPLDMATVTDRHSRMSSHFATSHSARRVLSHEYHDSGSYLLHTLYGQVLL